MIALVYLLLSTLIINRTCKHYAMNFEKKVFNYSTKNIPLQPEKVYKKLLVEKVELVIKRMRWKAHFFDQPVSDESSNPKYGFKTRSSPPQHKDLVKFEEELLTLVKNIKFSRATNTFQRKIINDIKSIKSSENVFVFADKTRNLYEMDKSTHKKLILENITKTYKKTDTKTYDLIDNEAKSFAEKFKVADRAECMAPSNAFITLKDHKENFEYNPKCRLINPAKSEIGCISKRFTESVNIEIRKKSKLLQWRDSASVIEWFNDIKEKENCCFVQFDIADFYPSISKQLLQKAIRHAKKYVDISKEEIDTIMHARKSLLFNNGEIWIKKEGDPMFDVTMGSFDGAEICELVGLYILYKLEMNFKKASIGLYRDDGLACFKNLNGSQADRIRKKFIKIFKEDFGLSITIETNLKAVNFLDITLDLPSGTHKPYCKPNDVPIYINTSSNHPKSIIKAIPRMIEMRLSNLSSNKCIFDQAKPLYEQALKDSGFEPSLSYQQQQSPPKNGRNRKRNTIWFNPPFNLNVTSNIAKDFLKLLDKTFPRNHRFYKIFNRNNVKVSYCTLPNFAAAINAHNKRILRPTPENNRGCNCRDGSQCPLNGKCLQTSVIYQCEVKSSTQGKPVHYIGCTSSEFKNRFTEHKSSFNTPSKKSATTLAAHVWSMKEIHKDPDPKWSIIDKSPPYSHGTRRCPLCVTEKYHITFSNLNLLNQRSEIAQKCRHENKYLLKNFKSWIKTQADNG